MKVKAAMALVDQIKLSPTMRLECADHTSRFEDAICVRVWIKTVNSNEEAWWDDDDHTEIEVRSDFCIQVGGCATDDDLYRKIMDEAIVPTLIHESREFFRIAPTGRAPFHPHNEEGMARWGTPHLDRTYGLT